jgi:hypothetical protein
MFSSFHHFHQFFLSQFFRWGNKRVMKSPPFLTAYSCLPYLNVHLINWDTDYILGHIGGFPLYKTAGELWHQCSHLQNSGDSSLYCTIIVQLCSCIVQSFYTSCSIITYCCTTVALSLYNFEVGLEVSHTCACRVLCPLLLYLIIIDNS